MTALSDQLAFAYHQKFVNRTVGVLVEREQEGMLVGHTDNYIQVALPAVKEGDLPIGEIIAARIVSVTNGQVEGILDSGANFEVGTEGGA